MSDRTSLPTQRWDGLIEGIAAVAGPRLFRWFDAHVEGVDHIPEGPALLVGNHSGGMSTPDTFLLCAAILRERGVDHVPFGLAHSVVTEVPGLRALIRAIGGVRGCHEEGARLFAEGRKVLVYPGGDYEAYRPSRDRGRIDFGGRKGYARLAYEHGVPIVPVVSAGSHDGFLVFGDLTPVAERLGLTRLLRVRRWPMTVSFPWGFLPSPCPPYLPLPTRVFVEVLPPVAPPSSLDEVDAWDRALRGQMQQALDRLLRARKDAGAWACTSWRGKQ
jgi:1-acyl-sn-glycerol-3-phosphate acyltransferase